MKTATIAAAVIAMASTGCFASRAHAAAAPCEDKLVEFRAAMSSAKAGEADMEAARKLEAKGVERCNADDDKRADAFFDDALKLVKK